MLPLLVSLVSLLADLLTGIVECTEAQGQAQGPIALICWAFGGLARRVG